MGTMRHVRSGKKTSDTKRDLDLAAASAAEEQPRPR